LRRFGQVFDSVAAEYDAARPSYPGELVDAAMQAGGIGPHASVLEVGSGTGKLTELLADRRLRIHAVEPGANLVEAARRRVRSTNAVQFEIARFEDADLAVNAYDAVFSATAFHWLDPEVSWKKVAAVLKPGGLLALLTHVGIRDDRSDGHWEQFREVLRMHAPDVVERLGPPRSLDRFVAGVRERSSNVSEVWDWVMGEGRHALAIPETARLFRDVELRTVLSSHEETADQLLAQFRTTSLYFMIEPDRRQAFEADDRRLIESAGGTIRSTLAAVLVTARRSTASVGAS
jgi:SAM-dependent methyltransferase